MTFTKFIFIIFIIILIYKLRFLIKNILSSVLSVFTYDTSATAFAIFTILFVALVISLKEMVGGFETFKSTNLIDLNNKDLENLFNSEHFNDYIKSIHTNMYSKKLIPFNKHFTEEYKARIVLVPNEYKKELNNAVDNANKILNKSGLIPLINLPWKIAISRNGLEMNMPFTLDDIIIMPLDTIKFLNQSENSDLFIQTLIHEKIHILQRKNQDKFNEFYKNEFNFIKSKNDFNIPEQWNKINMTNPDSNFDKWTYIYNSKEYYPILGLINGKITDIGFNINNNDDMIKLKEIDLKLPNDYIKNCSLYHPNEIIACDLSEKIFRDKIPNKYIKLIKDL